MAQELEVMPTRKCLPASCGAILQTLETHGKEFDLWKCGNLPVITETIKVAAKTAQIFVEERLTSADPELIKGAIATLLTHYYVGNLPEHVHEAISSDWLEDLGNYPDWAISQARKEWRQNNKRKPTPGHMVELCNKAISKDQALLRQCRAILNAPLTPEPEPELTEEERSARAMEISRVVAEAKKNLTE